MENPIENWYNSDKKLQDLIFEIESSGNSFPDMAEMAFEKLCEVYNIPRMPEDLLIKNEFGDYDTPDEEKEDEIGKRSLFEEHAFIKYLSDENEDPRGMVLSAAWHLLNDYRVDLWQIAKKEYGNNIPERCQIAVRGEGYHGEVVFPNKEDKSWTELGCITNNLLI